MPEFPHQPTVLAVKWLIWTIRQSCVLNQSRKTRIRVGIGSVQSAVKAAEMNKEDLLLAKTQADITADARKGIDPSTGREDIDLANFKPIPLPDPIYQDPMKPNVGPPPIKGATQSLNSMGDVLPGAAISGAIAGIGAYTAASGVQALSAAAGPIGLAVGGLTFLGGLL